MLNLLPQDKKKSIKKEYKTRRIVVALSFAAMTLVVLLIFLLPSYLIAKIRFEQASAADESLKSQVDAEKGKETNFTDAQKQMLNVLQGGSIAASSTTVLLNAVLASKGNDISLTDFSFQIVGGSGEVLLHGTAKSRDDLISFKQKLENDRDWNAVDLPISDLGPAKDNEFTITLTVSPTK